MKTKSKKSERIIKERTPVNLALKKFLEKVTWKTEVVALQPVKACNMVLAEDVFSNVWLPPFDRATMDGYAVRAEDTFGASQLNPVILELSGTVEIGKKPGVKVERGKAVKISTGAMMPENSNAVVMVEYTSEHDGIVEVYKPVSPGENVSFKGEDLKPGEVVIKKLSIVQPHDVALLSAVTEKVKVYRKPIVAVISTGDELCEPEEFVSSSGAISSKIPDLNRSYIKTMLKNLGCEVKDFGILKDDSEVVKDTLLRALKESDMVVVSGATSAGSRDFMPDILNEIGEVVVHGVAIKPGMPTALCVVEGKPVILLPGFPVAAYIAFRLFAIPAVWKLQNVKIMAFPGDKVKATLVRRIPSNAGTRTFTRVRLEVSDKGYIAHPVRTSGSGILTSIVKADGILEVDESSEGVEAGEVVEVEVIRHIVDVVR